MSDIIVDNMGLVRVYYERIRRKRGLPYDDDDWYAAIVMLYNRHPNENFAASKHALPLYLWLEVLHVVDEIGVKAVRRRRILREAAEKGIDPFTGCTGVYTLQPTRRHANLDYRLEQIDVDGFRGWIRGEEGARYLQAPADADVLDDIMDRYYDISISGAARKHKRYGAWNAGSAQRGLKRAWARYNLEH